MRCDVAGRTFAVRVNSLGMRGPELRPDSGTRRVLLLGDSTTFGFGVGEHETFAARVQEILRCRGHTDVEVLNAGVPGYSTWQSLANLRRLGNVVDPQIVVLTFYEGNDFTDNLRQPHPRVVEGVLWGGPALTTGGHRRAGVAGWVSRAEFELRWAMEQCHLVRLVRRALDRREGERTSLATLVARADAQPFLQRAWERTRVALDEVLAETRRGGTSFVLMALPGPLAFEGDASPEKAAMARLAATLHARLGVWARDRRVTFVSPAHALGEAARTGPVLLSADRHFNGRGHAVQARELAATIDRLLLSGPEVARAN
jgi:lysophospholipase L1-like esterase